jgi:hypothetical protein
MFLSDDLIPGIRPSSIVQRQNIASEIEFVFIHEWKGGVTRKETGQVA